MKTHAFMSFLVMVLATTCAAQKHLTRFKNAPICNYRIDDFYFIDKLNGWLIEDNLYRTTDGGQTWEKHQGMGRGRSIEFMDKDTGVAGVLNGYFLRTTDGGKNWFALLDSNLYESGACGLTHVGKTFFACGRYSGPARFFISTNGGRNWAAKSLDSLARGLVDCYFFNELEGLLSGTGLDSTNSFIILKTKDGGKTWINVFSAPGVSSYVWKIFPLNDTVLYASMQGLYNGFTYFLKSSDRGETWQLIKTDIKEDKIQGIGFINENEGWMGGWFPHSYYTKDGGSTWQIQPYGSGLNRFFKLPNGRLLASGNTLYEISDLASVQDIDNLKLHNISALFPNPASNQLNIKFNMKLDSYGTFHILNTLGKLMLSTGRKKYLEGENTETIFTDKLPPGNYHLIFLTDENHLKLKFVVVR